MSIILMFSLFAQTKKPVKIQGFDGKTFIKYPNEKIWKEADNVDTNYVKDNQLEIKYTNFDGEIIDFKNKKPIFIPKNKDIISTINVANDPTLDHYNLHFQLKKNAKIMIQVYTTDGFRVSDIVWEKFKEGLNKVNIKKKFTKGSYVIYMTIEDKVYKHRVLLD